jgi:hypothetical protein
MIDALSVATDIPPYLRQRVLDTARDLYVSGANDDVEIDDDAKISMDDTDPDDRRFWVQAWVYVREEDLAPVEEDSTCQST